MKKLMNFLIVSTSLLPSGAGAQPDIDPEEYDPCLWRYSYRITQVTINQLQGGPTANLGLRGDLRVHPHSDMPDEEDSDDNQ